jgi:hypothetical protein
MIKINKRIWDETIRDHNTPSHNQRPIESEIRIPTLNEQSLNSPLRNMIKINKRIWDETAKNNTTEKPYRRSHNPKSNTQIPTQSRSPQTEPARNIIKINKNIRENTTATQQSIIQSSTSKRKRKQNESKSRPTKLKTDKCHSNDHQHNFHVSR